MSLHQNVGRVNDHGVDLLTPYEDGKLQPAKSVIQVTTPPVEFNAWLDPLKARALAALLITAAEHVERAGLPVVAIEERKAIVAWLRRAPDALIAQAYATAIEAGEHHGVKP